MFYLASRKTGFIQANGRERIAIVACRDGQALASFPPSLNGGRVPDMAEVRRLLDGEYENKARARATQTRYYKALDGRDFVQFSTPVRRDWLVTNGPASEASDLQSQHADLIRRAS